MLLLISTTSPPTHRDHPPNGRVCAQWDARATHTPHSLLQLRNSNTTPTPTTKMTSSNYSESLHSIYGTTSKHLHMLYYFIDNDTTEYIHPAVSYTHLTLPTKRIV